MSYRIPSALPRDWRPRSRAVAALVAALTFAAACGEVVDPVSPGRSPRGLSAALEEEQGVCDQLLEIAANGTYCGVNTRIVPWAPADAYWGGATFQSDPGHGQSHDITITFDAPVAQVEITAYDPTFAGNAMYAYDQNGTLVGSADFPGNGTPGVLTTQTRTVSGSIMQVHLTAASGDYLNYSMRVKYRGAMVQIIEAKGINDDSFLAWIPPNMTGAAAREDYITLKAKVLLPELESQVTWKVEDWQGDAVTSYVPSPDPTGLETSFRVPDYSALRSARWAQPHPYDLSRFPYAYEIRAVAGTSESEKKVVRQDMLDVQRQAYIDMRVPQNMIPSRASFGSNPYSDSDFPLAVVNARFDALYTQLETSWAQSGLHALHVNGGYRDPGHNVFHVDAGVSSGSVRASWHQYGCAYDLQTYPVPRDTPERMQQAVEYWDALTEEARQLGFRVERRGGNPPYSGVGHVHIELRCYN